MPVKLYGPESGEMLNDTVKYIEAITADKLVMSVMDSFAYHSYHADNKPEDRYAFYEQLVSKYPQLGFDMSEWCELPNKSHTKDFKGALITARIIGQDLIYAGAQSWTSWVAVNGFAIKEDGLDYSDAMITANEDFSQWYIAQRYWGVAHFTKYIPVGSTALDIGFRPQNDKNDFNVFAFVTPDNETVLVVVNEGGEQTLELEGSFEKMKIIQSAQDYALKEIYNADALSRITCAPNSIMTILARQ